MPIAGKLCCWLAGLQALAIIGLETTILVKVLQHENVFRSWSSDKGVAIYFLLLVIAAIYGVFLVIGGVLAGDTIQLIGFCMLNLFAMSLAIFQYVQVRAWLESRPFVTLVRESIDYETGLSILRDIRPEMYASIGVLASMTLVFVGFAYILYNTFGWEIFKKVGADMKIRRMYIGYRLLVLLLKIDFFVFLGFAVSYIILILKSTDPEFAITVALVPVTLLVLVLAFWGLRRESHLTMWTFIFLLCGSTAYFVYKCARMYDPKQEDKYAKQRPMMTYYTIISLVVMSATLYQSVVCLANFGYGLRERIEMTAGKRSDMERIQDYYVNAAGDRRMPLEG
ncbi:hypothetical protein GGI12_001115 [Dipsacomyces acuminosporus]|nr:hypothetical protein GGI12_001115 [Dipsacomyces acuminosporus]